MAVTPELPRFPTARQESFRLPLPYPARYPRFQVLLPAIAVGGSRWKLPGVADKSTRSCLFLFSLRFQSFTSSPPDAQLQELRSNQTTVCLPNPSTSPRLTHRPVAQHDVPEPVTIRSIDSTTALVCLSIQSLFNPTAVTAVPTCSLWSHRLSRSTGRGRNKPAARTNPRAPDQSSARDQPQIHSAPAD
jgi:hypothetical protein